MPMYIWRNGWLGAVTAAFADTVEEAKQLVRSTCSDYGESMELELNNPPEVFDTPKSITIWADMYDINES